MASARPRGDQGQLSGWDFLNDLWSKPEAIDREYCSCSQEIELQDMLARTFCLQSQLRTKIPKCAKEIEVSALSDTILVYHRHIDCLWKSVRYIAISHVWHPSVANLQYHKSSTTASINDVERLVRESTVHIYRGLATHLSESFELWHDYISVSQWLDSLKTPIIRAIPQIFSRSWMTVAHLSDIEANHFMSMRKGCSAYERCRGISDICNAQWFSRMWTIMEFTQTHKLRIMIAGFELIEEDHLNRPFPTEMRQRWEEERARIGDGHIIEGMVDIKRNLVPWQLGPLQTVGRNTVSGIRTSFAMAHELLVRRCVTVPGDFLHALSGILKQDTPDSLLHDIPKGLIYHARSCLEHGDLSPFFMVPTFSKAVVAETDNVRSGYIDLTTFGLGDQKMPPTFPVVGFSTNSGDPIIRAESLGAVQSVEKVDRGVKQVRDSFSNLFKMTLKTTGPDAEILVAALGSRLYGQEIGQIHDRLAQEDRWHELQSRLDKIHGGTSCDPEADIDWIAGAIGLADRSLGGGLFKSVYSPMMFTAHHGDTLHLGASGAIAGVKCPGCQRAFLLRVGLASPAAEVVGAVAYRVPGLRYWFTHQGGAGFLLKNGYIVGRFVWGTPTCDCDKIEDVEVVLKDLALPRPNNFRYGQS